MADTQTQPTTKDESQKTVVSFVFGLLIGGLLVWAFMGGDNAGKPATEKADDDTVEVTTDTPAETTTELTTETADAPEAAPALVKGEGKVDVSNVTAGMSLPLAGATYPVAEGWVGIRDYTDNRMGPILGVVRFSEAQGLVPKDIILQRPMVAGRQYAVVFFTEDGDRIFNSATDTMVQTELSTFTAK